MEPASRQKKEALPLRRLEWIPENRLAGKEPSSFRCIRQNSRRFRTPLPADRKDFVLSQRVLPRRTGEIRPAAQRIPIADKIPRSSLFARERSPADRAFRKSSANR